MLHELKKVLTGLLYFLFVIIVLSFHFSSLNATPLAAHLWKVESNDEWLKNKSKDENLEYKNGMVSPTSKVGVYSSIIHSFKNKRSVKSISITQSPVWENWDPVSNIGPTNLLDAPVLLSLGENNTWIFGRYGQSTQKDFKPESVELKGFNIPLFTTPWPKQFNAPGGLKKSLGGYHAWQSRDMITWVHHGPITETFSRWVTSVEAVDGKIYIYYDYPNDQDPHLYIDEDLTDGLPGKNMGLAFKDPSDGSDCAIIRDLEGKFHLFYEDWSPINARQHSWDSPLAGHAVSLDGIKNFELKKPAIDQRTHATGLMGKYLHPHWTQHPEWDSNEAKYQIHKPEQNAYGDWAAICIGEQAYLFGDFHPAKKQRHEMKVAWFTSSSLDGTFNFCGQIGNGHPDPDITFTNGMFYLVTQMKTDYTSYGPWVEKVEARVGVDINNNGSIDQWSTWQELREIYKYKPGFAKQVERKPATINVQHLPEGYGFQFEFRTTNTTDNISKPIVDSVVLEFEY